MFRARKLRARLPRPGLPSPPCWGRRVLGRGPNLHARTGSLRRTTPWGRHYPSRPQPAFSSCAAQRWRRPLRGGPEAGTAQRSAGHSAAHPGVRGVCPRWRKQRLRKRPRPAPGRDKYENEGVGFVCVTLRPPCTRIRVLSLTCSQDPPCIQATSGYCSLKTSFLGASALLLTMCVPEDQHLL